MELRSVGWKVCGVLVALMQLPRHYADHIASHIWWVVLFDLLNVVSVLGFNLWAWSFGFGPRRFWQGLAVAQLPMALVGTYGYIGLLHGQGNKAQLVALVLGNVLIFIMALGLWRAGHERPGETMVAAQALTPDRLERLKARGLL